MAASEMRRGVSLRQYAAMHAAVAAGARRAELIAAIGLDEATWSLAEEGWMDRLDADEGDETPLQEAYDEALAAAQARYARAVKPYDDDLRAWLDFVRIWAAVDAPLAVLARLGLTSSDLIHLHRTWSGRLGNSPPLQRAALHIMEQEPLFLELPTPQPRPEVLLPSAAEGEELLPTLEELAELEAEEAEEAAEGGAEAAGAPPIPVFASLPQSEGDVVPAAAASLAPAPAYPSAEAASMPPPPSVVPRAMPSADAANASILSHAKMNAELAAFPTRTREVLARFGVSSPEQQQALDHWWKATVERAPELDAVWWEAYTRHYDVCLRRR